MFAITSIIAAVKKPSMEYMLGPIIKFKIVVKTNIPKPTILRFHLPLFLNNILASPLSHAKMGSCLRNPLLYRI